MRLTSILFTILTVVVGCTNDYSDLPQLSVDFKWPEKRVYEISPEIKLGNVPAGTRQLIINMFDLDNRYDHGGGTVEYNNSKLIPEGALKKYQGPAPSYGAPRYEISIKAIDEDGNVIAFGKKTKKFPPEPE